MFSWIQDAAIFRQRINDVSQSLTSLVQCYATGSVPKDGNVVDPT